ncbi:Lipid carrier : UDP-N-acetylgalactosaminyltransferase / Alpha-1,3-N-acetylgalactosamine transferase PglA; Putative glycosyltransferase [hydrothermal vent metagenome]|uniref:Lipid carrier: UDP-N-acetylgalactosaminyltransferase / Alpha-1,3-N-acetylgalactosamine transferase PglA Putative glycosyltransferase n=1 Tax=hydrothermal vent metagenome TaxID=652676 RepID=A0A1W1D0S7_9ZZZZ
MARGSFTISLDFELFWGVRAKRELADYEENLLGVYEVIPKILSLFEKYNIHATWATVGFLFYKDIEDIKKDIPKNLPNYQNRKVDPYVYLNSLNSSYSEKFSKLHCASSLINKIAESKNQELATHTYSHFFTYEPLKSKEAFIIDMKKAITLGIKKGYSLKSLVFPRNQIDLTYIDTLKLLGVESYRTNPNHWAYCDGDKPSKSFFLRLYRLFDTYVNISGHHTSLPILKKGVAELKSSMMLRPYFDKLSYLESLKLNRIKKAMKHAATHGQNFHLWWHPHNFGKNQEKNLKNLEELLLYFQKLQKNYNMLSLTMDEVKNMLIDKNKNSIKTVAVVLNTSWNIYNFRLALIKALREVGYKVILIAPRDEYTQKLEEEGFVYYDIKMNNKGVNPFEDLLLTYNFYKLYQKIKPDILLNYTIKPNIYSSLAGKYLGIPVVNNITGLGTVFLNNNISSHIARWLYKISLRKNSVVFQNKDDMKLFIEKKLLKKKLGTLIPGSGVDTERFKSKYRTLKNKNFTFLMIARLIKDKGIKEYIEAIRLFRQSNSHKNCTFKILGSLYLSNPTAISKQELDSWIKEGLIEYLGYSDNVQEEIDKVDCVVLPSYREGLSRVLLEASSMAKPIITTNVPGCRDVVDNGVNGYLVEVKNSVELAKAITKMVNLPIEKLRHMGKEGRKKVLNDFSDQKVIDKYLSILKKFNSQKRVSFQNSYNKQVTVKQKIL